MKKTAIPVVMYHSIGIPNKNWNGHFLTIPYHVFENQLKWMKKKKFHTISLQQLYDYMNTGVVLPENPIVLTFDDGYVDNWIFAYPILKKYGFQATIYVNPEFVDPRNQVRKNLEDVWRNEITIDKLERSGYLSWGEMEIMEKQGIADIQSHTMSHTWYPTTNKIIDFRNPDDTYIWMTWNKNPSEKPFLQIDNKKIVRFGQPVYEYDRSISIKRYFPDRNLDEFVISYVTKKGGKDFFKSHNWRLELHDVVKKYTDKNSINERYESEEEYEKRLYYELHESKNIIEKKLNKKIKFVCWPGGAVSPKALNLASEIGYISSTAGRDLDHMRNILKNKSGDNPSRINRIGSVLYWNGIIGFESKIKYKNGFLLLLSIYYFEEKKVISSLSKIFLSSVKQFYRMKLSI